jgi:hypothetical protein
LSSAVKDKNLEGGIKEVIMRTRLWIVLLVILLASAPLALSQSRDTGAITGKVTDDQRNPLPGVTVNLSSPSLMGVRATTTDANGEFRFPALPPGTYAVKAELQGFQTALREDVRVNTTLTLTVDLELRPMAMAEEVTVVAQTPTVDVKSTETASVTLSNEILRNIPYNQFTSDIVNLAPGVVNNVAYGASANTGIAYTIDGVNVADPEAGSAWVFMDHNAVEEAKVMGIALPAEYGNFTGVIFNLVTKSGGNAFSGHMELDFQGQAQDKPAKFWQAVNNQAYLDDFPTLTSPSSRLMDISGHLGGPIVKDRLWFYTGAQYYRSQNRPTGFPEDVDYKQPRWFGKLTAQATPTLNVMATVEVDTYNGLNRHDGDPKVAGGRGQLQPDEDPQPKNVHRPQGRLLHGLLLSRPRERHGHQRPLQRRREQAHRQLVPLLLCRPVPFPGQRQPDPLRGEFHRRFARFQVRRGGRALLRPQPLRLYGREPHFL